MLKHLRFVLKHLGFGLSLVLFKLDVFFCFKYIIASVSEF